MNEQHPSQRKTRRGWESSQHSPLLVSKREAAEMLGLCVRTLDALISTKELAVCRVGKRVLVKVSSLEQFVRRDHDTATTTAEQVQ